MSEAKNSEIGEPIDRPSIYRTLLIAFVTIDEDEDQINPGLTAVVEHVI